jgi:hypothetical protein
MSESELKPTAEGMDGKRICQRNRMCLCGNGGKEVKRNPKFLS